MFSGVSPTARPVDSNWVTIGKDVGLRPLAAPGPRQFVS
jgi:hypothetical protein